MKLKPITVLAALVLIGAGGFIAGRSTTPTASPVAKEGPAETRSSRNSSTTANGGAAKDGKMITKSSRGERVQSLNPEERLARLENIVRDEDPLDRTRSLLAFIDQLAPGDFEAAIAHFRSLGLTDTRRGEYSMLLTAWAQADPIAALTYAKENTRQGFATETILASWATVDPNAAIEWAKTNFDGDGANPYLPGIIRSLATSDPARATELLASMPRSEERAKGLDAFLPHLLEQGADATRAWIAALPDDALRNGAMMRVADKLAASDPAGTVSWLLQNPSEASQRRMDDVYSTWAQKDQEAALTSFASLPAGEERSNALRGVLTSVAVNDPKAAVSMLDRYPNDVNDRVIQSVVWHSFGNDPATAANQIARISDEGQRNNMYRRAIGAWLERDPGAAQAWLKTNPLPEAVQKELSEDEEE
jgi:hypothetical protein